MDFYDTLISKWQEFIRFLTDKGIYTTRNYMVTFAILFVVLLIPIKTTRKIAAFLLTIMVIFTAINWFMTLATLP